MSDGTGANVVRPCGCSEGGAKVVAAVGDEEREQKQEIEGRDEW